MWSASHFSCFIHNNRISNRRGNVGGGEPVWMPWKSENYVAHSENLTEFFWVVLCCVSSFPIYCAILSIRISFSIRFQIMLFNLRKW
jgi:hypothetical protein